MLHNFFNLARSCRQLRGEIKPLLEAKKKTTTLQVRLDITTDSQFCLGDVLETLRIKDGFGIIKLFPEVTLRVIWPKDDIEFFLLLGQPNFFDEVFKAPKQLQLEIPTGYFFSTKSKRDIGPRSLFQIRNEFIMWGW